MSKVDAQRALRDARYARFAAEKSAAPAPAKKAAPAAGSVPAEVRPPAAKPARGAKSKAKTASPGDELFSAPPPAEGELPPADPATSIAAEPAPTTESEVVAVEPGSVATDPEPITVEPRSTTAEPAESTAEPAEVGVDSAAETAETTEELCGHRSMNGRTCTRDKGHEQKNHRYN